MSYKTRVHQIIEKYSSKKNKAAVYLIVAITSPSVLGKLLPKEQSDLEEKMNIRKGSITVFDGIGGIIMNGLPAIGATQIPEKVISFCGNYAENAVDTATIFLATRAMLEGTRATYAAIKKQAIISPSFTTLILGPTTRFARNTYQMYNKRTKYK